MSDQELLLCLPTRGNGRGGDHPGRRQAGPNGNGPDALEGDGELSKGHRRFRTTQNKLNGRSLTSINPIVWIGVYHDPDLSNAAEQLTPVQPLSFAPTG